MTSDKYILDDSGNPVAEPDLTKWGKWLQNAKRHVAYEKIGDVRISTVFLGSDHNWGDGPPVLWETMVFCHGHPLDQEQDRCSGSREQAEAMHAKMVERVRCANSLDEPRGANHH